jgi:CelD/BcsL family acetyltransferase involved in cellulose biosynthesis
VGSIAVDQGRAAHDVVPLSSLEEAREPWALLAERTENVFSTWEWADVWWRHFAAGDELGLAAVRQDGETSAILPMYVHRRLGRRVMRFLGHGVADQLGPVCDASAVPSACAGLGELLGGGGMLVAERMPSERDWPAALRGTALGEEPSPLIDLDQEGDWESYLHARSSNFRQQARRRARRLRSLGVSFRLTERHDELDADFDALLRLHAARWGSGSRAFAGARGRFHREFAARALDRGWLRLWIAEVEGAPVAAWYGFRFAGVDSYYQLGRDPAWDRPAVGAGLLEHTIRDAFESGMREYRLLRGAEEYKRRYATRDAGLCTVAAARGPLERAAVAALGMLARSRAGRRLLKRSAE